jgi:hypothetical protein
VRVSGQGRQEVAVQEGRGGPTVAGGRRRKSPVVAQGQPDEDVAVGVRPDGGENLGHLGVVVPRVDALAGAAVRPDQPEAVRAPVEPFDVDLVLGPVRQPDEVPELV